MEVKNVSVIFVYLILACVTFHSVQSASFYYRNGREIEIPVDNEIIREEIVAELKKEPEIIAIETEPIVALVKEEIIVPVDQLRVAAPVIDIQEPVAVISEKDETNAVVEEAVVLRNTYPETESIVPVVEEKIFSLPIVEESVAVAVNEDIPITRNAPLVEIDEMEVAPVAEVKTEDKEIVPVAEVKIEDKEIVPVAEVKTEDKETPIEVVGVALKSSPIEEEVVAVVEKDNAIIADAPSVQSEEAIRQSDAAPAGTPVRPTLFQAIQTQFQTQLQNFQNILNPNAAAANADSTVSTTVRPPGIIAQFQQAVFNRPAGSAASAASAGSAGSGPIQGLVTTFQNNVQNNLQSFQEFFRPNANAAASPTPVVPVVVAPAPVVPVVVAPADPVNEKTMLAEVPVVDAKIDVVEKVDEKVDEVKSD